MSHQPTSLYACKFCDTFKKLCFASSSNLTNRLDSLRSHLYSSNQKTYTNSMTEIAQAKRLRVRIKRWHGVATWTWGINEECCGICRNAFETCCPECTSPGDACPPVWGGCQHAFHMHCLVKWLDSSQSTCPMCRQEWEFQSS